MSNPAEDSFQLVSIIVPVFNEIKSLRQILDQIDAVRLDGLQKEIILVESGSTDGSTELCKQLATDRSYKLVIEEAPKGKGHAVREGFKHATGQIIMIQDADLEYSPTDYPELLKPIIEHKAQFVLGSRHLGAGTYKIRSYDNVWYSRVLNVGSIVFNVLFYSLYGIVLTDPQTMYKVFHRKCLEKVHFVSNRFDLDWEIVCKFVRAGFLPMEIPVSYHGRSNSEGKKIRIWPDAYLAARAIFRFRISKL